MPAAQGQHPHALSAHHPGRPGDSRPRSGSGPWPPAPTRSSRRAIDEQERRTRLWALLRSQALYRRQERKRESQGAALTRAGPLAGHLRARSAERRRGPAGELRVPGPGGARARPEDDRSRRRARVRSARPRPLLQQLTRGLRTRAGLRALRVAAGWPCKRVAVRPRRAAARGEGRACAGRLQRRAARPGPDARSSRPERHGVVGRSRAAAAGAVGAGRLPAATAPHHACWLRTSGRRQASRQRAADPGQRRRGDRPRRMAQRMFEPYVRVPRRAAARPGPRAGAGARSIVELHGGHGRR